MEEGRKEMKGRKEMRKEKSPSIFRLLLEKNPFPPLQWNKLFPSYLSRLCGMCGLQTTVSVGLWEQIQDLLPPRSSVKLISE